MLEKWKGVVCTHMSEQASLRGQSSPLHLCNHLKFALEPETREFVYFCHDVDLLCFSVLLNLYGMESSARLANEYRCEPPLPPHSM